jgi:NADH-quinone oxidoreductase subunit H
VSDLTPLAVLAVAVAGAFLVAWLEQLLAGAAPSPVLVARRVSATVRQPLARPETHDSWLFHLAPPLLLVAAVTALATVPWAPGFRGIDLRVGALLFGAALAYVTPAVFMAGWGAGRPLAVVGGFRFVAQMLAYAMPLTMAVTAVATPAESLRPSVIVDAQHAVPMLVSQPLAFVLFLPSVMAVAFIAPFDLPQARTELGGGVFSAYTGVQAGMIALAQRILVVAAAGMTAALFLSGWHGPLLPPALWMALKTLGVAALILWAGRRLPRVEIEPLLSWAWKVAIPAAIGAIVWAGLVTLLFYR